MSRGLPANAKVREQVGATLTGPPQVAFQYEQTIQPEAGAGAAAAAEGRRRR